MLFSSKALFLVCAAVSAFASDDDCEIEYVLFNADNEQSFGLLNDGDRLCIPSFEVNFQARATSACPPNESALQTLEGPVSDRRVENVGPYTQFGDSGGNIFGRTLLPGSYTIDAEIFADNDLSGGLVVQRQVRFEVMICPICSAGVGVDTSVQLSPEEEVTPVVGVGEDSSGVAILTVCEESNEICLNLDSDITGNPGEAAGGHLHMGGVGVNGPLVIDFGVEFPTFEGCSVVDDDLIRDVLDDPSNFYINIHTPLNPPGEIRGQVDDSAFY